MLKHKDDIRRRLTIAEVPKPPDDLMHRIKRDIPKHFTSKTSKEASRKPREPMPLWNFWGFSWQLAAGILVMVGLTWAVFESWRSEVSQPTRVAEAERAPTVEEFEAKVTGDAPFAEVPSRASGNEEFAGGRADATSTRPAAPLAAVTVPAAKPQFAPEAREKDAKAADRRRSETTASVERPQQPSTPRPMPVGTSEVPAEAAGSTGRDVNVAPKRQTQPLAEDAASAPAALAAGGSTATPGESVRVVAVKGLAEERVVRVQLDLDASGKVVEAKILDEVDRATRRAVTKSAMDWMFPPEPETVRGAHTAMTIDVQLRRQN